MQAFIRLHAEDDPASLMLKGHTDANFPLREAVGQIESRQKAKAKLPTLWQEEQLLWPPAISMEQCSSEATASYKASLVKGKTGLDLTGGLGIDTYFFSKQFDAFTYVEKDDHLCALARHNFQSLGASNVEVIAAEGIQWLSGQSQSFDFIYVDPSRRGSYNRRVQGLEDYSPDVVLSLGLLLNRAKQVMIKISPMFDIEEGLRKLRWVKEVHVIALRNECKELLFLLEPGYTGEAQMVAVNLKKNGQKQQVLRFSKKEEEQSAMALGMPQQYLYEPHAAIMKAGGFRTLAVRYGLKKLHPNSHLYTSELARHDFPGRKFHILEEFHPYSKKLKADWEGQAINITLRNFPESIKSLRKRLKLQEGGTHYLIGTTLADRKASLFLCEKLKEESGT